MLKLFIFKEIEEFKIALFVYYISVFIGKYYGCNLFLK